MGLLFSYKDNGKAYIDSSKNRFSLKKGQKLGELNKPDQFCNAIKFIFNKYLLFYDKFCKSTHCPEKDGQNTLGISCLVSCIPYG